MKLGIVANEFFSENLGPMGGFGWAARQVANTFRHHSHLGVTVVFLAAKSKNAGGLRCARVHDTTLLFSARGPNYHRTLLQQKLDLVLTIDYRPNYGRILNTLRSKPVIVWIRDPRPPAVQARIATLKFPNSSLENPKGINAIDCRSLSSLRARGRPLLFGTPAPTLIPFIAGAYGVDDADCVFLPNIVDMGVESVTKSDTPRVIFLGRLDPIKRPWLFVELARAFPQVEFLMLGKSHFDGVSSWSNQNLPANIKILGHVDGEEKRKLLTGSWVLVNTSIHESLATSFLEALACETPLLSCNNPEGIVSRFGVFINPCDGDGMSSLPTLVAELAQLLENHERRMRLGRDGRQWVERTHNVTTFLSAFDKLCKRAGLHRQSQN
jgi:glycosyltransferase involved in cell wall biosynthesis